MVEPFPAVDQLFENTGEIRLNNDECIVVASTSEDRDGHRTAAIGDLLPVGPHRADRSRPPADGGVRPGPEGEGSTA